MGDDSRQRKAAREHVVAFRLDPDLRNKLEELRAELQTPWRDVTISDVLRLVMLTGIEVVWRKRKNGTLRDGLGRPEDVLGRPRRAGGDARRGRGPG